MVNSIVPAVEEIWHSQSPCTFFLLWFCEKEYQAELPICPTKRFKPRHLLCQAFASYGHSHRLHRQERQIRCQGGVPTRQLIPQALLAFAGLAELFFLQNGFGSTCAINNGVVALLLNLETLVLDQNQQTCSDLQLANLLPGDRNNYVWGTMMSRTFQQGGSNHNMRTSHLNSHFALKRWTDWKTCHPSQKITKIQEKCAKNGLKIPHAIFETNQVTSSSSSCSFSSFSLVRLCTVPSQSARACSSTGSIEVPTQLYLDSGIWKKPMPSMQVWRQLWVSTPTHLR